MNTNNDNTRDEQAMNCLEFRRLALSNPAHDEHSFVEHRKTCPDCIKFIASVEKMDRDLYESVDVDMPAELAARLKLGGELDRKANTAWYSRRYYSKPYALAASVLVALVALSVILSSQISLYKTIESDYESLLAGVAEHMDEVPMVPVWSSDRANSTAKVLLASYDNSLNFKGVEGLRFSKICPMGRYKGLHATMQTEHELVTFAYIKGEPIGEMMNVSYQGYAARVRPLKNGNLVIMGRRDSAVQEAEKSLSDSMYWDI